MTVRIRRAQPGDEHELFQLIRGLAAYEHLENSVSGSAEQLAHWLFGTAPAAHALLAYREDEPVGYALYFNTFSTFLTQPGVWLEDLFVVPAARGGGVGSALLRAVAAEAARMGAGRLEWSVLDWNAPAIRFYERCGASILPDWRICRVTDDALRALSERA